MPRTGFDEPGGEEPREPEDLAVWLAAGFSREEAEIWRSWRIPIVRAQGWVQAGVTDGLTALQWTIAKVTPSSLPGWRDAGIGAPEALRWHEFGADLATARAQKQLGNGPEAFLSRGGGVSGLVPGGGRGGFGPGPFQRFRALGGLIAHTYMQRQWFDDAAYEWARNGIPADEAYIWHDLGLKPVEAGRLVLKGLTPGEVIGTWWRAGIPFDEVAQWIGAGLSVEEALEHKAKGVTAEEAAALRALRLDEPPAERPGGSPEDFLRQGPPGSSPSGPPPEDVDAARAEVTEAFEAMFTRDKESDSVPTVEGGENLGPCLVRAGEQLRSRGEQKPGVSTERIRFINDHEARVWFVVDASRNRGRGVGRQVGRAVLDGGRWKVARETFCQMMTIAGIDCPPRIAKPNGE